MSRLPHDGMQVYRRLIGYVFPYWPIFLVAVIALLLVAATEAGFAAYLKPMIDGSFVERDPAIIMYTPLVLIGLFFIRGIAAFTASYAMAWVGRKVINVLRGEMFNHLLIMPVSFFDHTPTGSLLSRFTFNVEQVARATTEVVNVLVRDTFTVIALLGWMFYLNWRLALVSLIGAPLIAYVINRLNRRFRRYSGRIQDSVGEVTAIAEEAIDGQRVVKTFGGQGYEQSRFAKANESNRRLNMKFAKTHAMSVPLVEFIAACGASGVIYIALLEVEQSDLSVGAFMSFIAAMMLLHPPLKRLTKVMESLQRGIAAADSIFTLIDLPAEQDRGTVSLSQCRGEVEYRQVTFAYSKDSEAVLKDISFRIEKGQSVAFVGRSGSGKSTLVGLLPRFHDVQQGTISIDGHDIFDLELQNLRDQISLVSQNITLFNDTIANNIAYGRLEGATREDIIAAARAAHAMEFIEQLPAGLDTMVGENGVLLSGGQRQRLAIARAILKDAPILILDEATSALDTESERHIQSALVTLMRNRTTLVIAHRLSTIERVDCIMVMDKGRIIEAGRHEELLAQNGHYANLYHLQFQEHEPA